MPADAFSLWTMIRDHLDPASESEKVHVKEESEEKGYTYLPVVK